MLSNTCFNAIVLGKLPEKFSPSKGFSDVRSTTESSARFISRMLFAFTLTSLLFLKEDILTLKIPIKSKITANTANTIPTMVDKTFLKKDFIFIFNFCKIKLFKSVYHSFFLNLRVIKNKYEYSFFAIRK
ncbi:MAG: Uncharacterised protein [Cryomorphaceae bacterium]|nr:MAG: Uncharacterised protein [Cryomorphaceae bacterium]